MKLDYFIIFQIVLDVILILYLVWGKYIISKFNNSYSSLILSIKDLLNAQKEMIEVANKKIELQQASLSNLLDDVRQKNSVLSELIRSVKIKTFENDTKKKIFDLVDQNLSIEEISKRLALPKGEVELIIKLYKEVE